MESRYHRHRAILVRLLRLRTPSKSDPIKHIGTGPNITKEAKRHYHYRESTDAALRNLQEQVWELPYETIEIRGGRYLGRCCECDQEWYTVFDSSAQKEANILL